MTFLDQEPTGKEKVWWGLNTPGAFSSQLEATTERPQALWEYCISSHCTNQGKRETLILLDMKLNYARLSAR